MTTIAGNSQCLVADSCASDEDQRWAVIKVERISGSLYATAGGAADGERFYAWIRRNRRGKRPAVAEEFSALCLNAKGLFLFDSELYPMPLMNAHAIGSGGKAARAAMAAGADIVRAVEIVCEIDASSALPIQIYRLDEGTP